MLSVNSNQQIKLATIDKVVGSKVIALGSGDPEQVIDNLTIPPNIISVNDSITVYFAISVADGGSTNNYYIKIGQDKTKTNNNAFIKASSLLGNTNVIEIFRRSYNTLSIQKGTGASGQTMPNDDEITYNPAKDFYITSTQEYGGGGSALADAGINHMILAAMANV